MSDDHAPRSSWPPAHDVADTSFEQAPCGYLTTTPDGRIVHANSTLAEWLGISTDALVSMSLVDLLTPGGRLYHETHLSPLLHMHDEVNEIAVDLRRHDGTRMPVLLNARMTRYPDGTPSTTRIAVLVATERRRYERELLSAKERAETSEARARTLARTLQQTLIPPTPPAVPDLDVAAAYRPAGDGTEVGGDFYDVFSLGQDDWMVVLGDVRGKGPEAAVVTALVRYTVRALAVATRRPCLLLEQVNETLLQHSSDRFCTAVLVRLRRREGGWRAEIGVAGHPAPLLLRADDRARQIDLLGPLLGVIDDAVYTDREIFLGPGDTMLLYTDGVTEASGPSGFFGDERLLDMVDSGPTGSSAEVVDNVLSQVLAFQNGVARDDIALLALGVPTH
ncbi:sigma-B regulation protein RsbU (phosphoserine phosphatase) [Nocardioides marinisabuli]|uniref:Sigma-B regulation protein RsbU (Phosphoserine phosphatase) n=1 Tax=Nocardioides marinisabuli TaxID=419476 RepID=A0A7Y9F2Q4_9ACTN|nr:SpoIIE family protein phosphatase [Nocardioides marinisabuli]NYD58276.1 sigma-B regulation protein RsbU (phosphoserine phosphatase) [Nocardioides marinisabuli]